MNGLLGSLQFYNANADSHVMDLGVMPMSTAVRAAEKEIANTHITHVVFLPNGEWMATVDMRDE
jgi:NET1-associated nuclear protein 1 (U3 small nucleolar RNA-associated protein 17)